MTDIDSEVQAFASNAPTTGPEYVQTESRRLLKVIRESFRGLNEVDGSERTRRGAELNELKARVEKVVSENRRPEERGRRDLPFAEDLDLPGPMLRVGRVHPIISVIRTMNRFFTASGFEVVDGPEIELDEFNFTALNIPAGHPSREMQDTIYIASSDRLLRTHTSSVEIRVMMERPPPLRIVAPGKAFRFEDVNTSNNYMFFQYEGLAIDQGLDIGHLIGLLSDFVTYMFGLSRKRRIRSKYYPQVEPGLGMDLACEFCDGRGCQTCKYRGWIEILGAGMVHPNVLARVGIDWHEQEGFAFGMGVDRIAMAATGLRDIRELYGERLSYVSEI